MKVPNDLQVQSADNYDKCRKKILSSTGREYASPKWDEPEVHRSRFPLSVLSLFWKKRNTRRKLDKCWVRNLNIKRSFVNCIGALFDPILSSLTSVFDAMIWWHATMVANSSAQGSTSFDMLGLIWVLYIASDIFTSYYCWSQNSSAFDIYTDYSANTLYKDVNMTISWEIYVVLIFD